jgi:hypothetical protein
MKNSRLNDIYEQIEHQFQAKDDEIKVLKNRIEVYRNEINTKNEQQKALRALLFTLNHTFKRLETMLNVKGITGMNESEIRDLIQTSYKQIYDSLIKN